MDLIQRVPPQNIEAEQSVLGAMLLEKEAIITAAEILKEEDFYRDPHKKLFEVIIDIHEGNEPVDLITVTEELRKKNSLNEIGGATYITSLVNSIPTAANIAYHAAIVKEKSVLRKLINVS